MSISIFTAHKTKIVQGKTKEREKTILTKNLQWNK